MFEQVLRTVTAPLGETLTRALTRLWADLPFPRDEPHVFAMGPNPDRVLLIGGGAVVGFGVASHELALGGQLARRLSALTDRGAEVEIIVDVNLTVEQVVRILDSYDLSRFDAVVVMVGMRETLSLSTRGTWRDATTALLDSIEQGRSPDLATVIVGIPPLPRSDSIVGFVRLLGRRTPQFNAATADLVSQREDVSFVAITADDLENKRGGTMYGIWAELIAPVVRTALDRASATPRASGPIDEAERQVALDKLQIVDTPADERFDEITTLARDLFGVSAAAVNFIDHDRQWVKSAAGWPRIETPRELAFCNVTIRDDRLFVLEDATQSTQFAANPIVTGATHIRFYAGYPLESPGGERVGTLCLVDTEPRKFSRADASLLRELALRVQSLLWSVPRELRERSVLKESH
jgi:hypothetical protein